PTVTAKTGRIRRGRMKGERCSIARIARRPRPPDEILSRKDLAELQRKLSMMSVTAVQDFYSSAHMVCRIGPGHFPSARAIQELVQAWKQMRKWRGPPAAPCFRTRLPPVRGIPSSTRLRLHAYVSLPRACKSRAQ